MFLDFYPNLSAALGIIDLVVGVWVKSGPGDKMQKWTRTQRVVEVSTGLNRQSRAQQVAKDSWPTLEDC